jgi:hypothetical protein
MAAATNDVTAKITGKSNAMKGVYGDNYLQTATLLDMIKVFAPSSDNNKPSSYANTVAKEVGITSDTKLKDLQNKIPQIVKAMIHVEDYRLYNEIFG